MRPSKTNVCATLGLALLVVTLPAFTTVIKPAVEVASVQAFDSMSDVKSSALRVLQLKCNTCHARQNPGKVFTSNNMNTLAARINEQVFVKRRMPRGKRLTNEEYTSLQNWLNTQNIK